MRTKNRWRRKGGQDRRGGALVVSLVVVVIIAGIAAATFSISLAPNQEMAADGRRLRALYMAEAGISDSLAEIAATVTNSETVPQALGTDEKPVSLKGGKYWADLTENADGTYTVVSRGTAGQEQRAIQAVIAPPAGTVFDHAIFAGNSSGDPTYTLDLGGVGGQADSISGNIYSAGDIQIDGDATVAGELAATGAINGDSSASVKSKAIPDIAGMDYENNHDFDVAALFAAGATAQSDALGGTAMQMPEESPVHFLRMNPDDRQSEIDGTVKDDYFLEDPYTASIKDWDASYYAPGKQGHTVTLPGTKGTPGENCTNKVFFIDGNLWIHNKPFGRLRFHSQGQDGVRLTFVVKGNIMFSDDVKLHNENKDGLAFIAIEDPDVPDSGNIYLGDPIYGTIDSLDAFLYAENDFVDFNLDEQGSKQVQITGNMTAGNHVAIERDYVDESDGSIEHSKLSVVFDDRISTGAITLPGLPLATQGGSNGFQVVHWREVAID